jgi:hypothetical protein
LEKNAFISLLKRYNSTTDGEAATVIDLRKQFPYSQVLQSLAARLSKDHELESHQSILQDAAVYSADRSALKEIFFEPYVPFTESEITTKGSESTPISEGEIRPSIEGKMEVTPVSKAEDQKLRSIETVDSVDYADEIMRDLEKLNTLKHNFEMLFVEYSEIESKPKKIEQAPEIVITQNNDIRPVDGESDIAGDSIAGTKKSKKARIIELAKNLGSGAGGNDHHDSKKSSRKKNPSEALIDEIQLTKEELTPESEKQKEQIEMINQFMRTQPSISAAKERQAPPIADLNPIKSGEFGDNIVSETLVEILIKQGKKEKAIEVLKKLIWKYPQKKTYFASQIEDLKK